VRDGDELRLARAFTLFVEAVCTLFSSIRLYVFREIVVKVYSYVVEHDTGHAPNPYFDSCTLCRCKFSQQAEKTQGLKGRKNIVELAEEGDWVIGTGGASKKSSGHGKLVYAMQVDEKLTRDEYFSDSRFAQKKRKKMGTYEQTQGDNLRPRNDFEKREQFALVSWYFYYFGANAVDIPERFKHLEKKGPGFRSHFEQGDIRWFLGWLEKTYKPGRQGEPRYQELPRRTKKCKSSC